MNDLFHDAAHDAPARARAVPVLVRPVRDVDLHDVRRDEPPLSARPTRRPRPSTRARTGSACCSRPTTASRRSPRILIPLVARVIGRRCAHLVNLSLGGLGLISFLFIDDPRMLLVAMVGVGIAWASILSLPVRDALGRRAAGEDGHLHGHLQFLHRHPADPRRERARRSWCACVFDGESIYALATGGVLMILAGLATLRVDDREAARAMKAASRSRRLALCRGRGNRRRGRAAPRTTTARPSHSPPRPSTSC